MKSRNKKNNPSVNLRPKKTGLPPGTLIYTGTKKTEETNINVITYDENSFTEKTYKKTDPFLENIPPNKLTWINVDGLNDIEVIEKIGSHFNLHQLVLEDILNVYQLPKADEYAEDDIIYITLNEFTVLPDQLLDRDQISIILGKNFVLSFQEKSGDYFNMVRDRIRNGKGKIRRRGTDYLVYALIDSVVDSYYLLLDQFAGELESIENEIFENRNRNLLDRIHPLNKDLINLRRSSAPLKEVIYHLMKEDTILVQHASKIFFRDLQDHMNQVVNQIDADREFLSDLINTNMTNLNSSLNETMKVLTLISTIFIPLTFIVGVYGMNFDFLPELHWHYGYLIVWCVMIAIVVFQVIIYKKNKWL